MPALYQRVLPYSDTPSWDFGRWQPDVVVVNLGTNDYSTDGDPTDAEFGGAYQAFLALLREKNPSAYILCLIPTFLGGTNLAKAQANIEAAVAARLGAGDAQVGSYAWKPVIDGWGCDGHPSAKTHAALGAALSAEIAARLGW
jgi:lysophospholipase L1-like esterase